MQAIKSEKNVEYMKTKASIQINSILLRISNQRIKMSATENEITKLIFTVCHKTQTLIDFYNNLIELLHHNFLWFPEHGYQYFSTADRLHGSDSHQLPAHHWLYPGNLKFHFESAIIRFPCMDLDFWKNLNKISKYISSI